MPNFNKKMGMDSRVVPIGIPKKRVNKKLSFGKKTRRFK